MTPEITLKLGKALVYTLKKKTGFGSPKVVVGKDTRLSGYMFEQAISAGITSMGGEVLLVGPLPTPAIAFITTNMRADAGVVISASHNHYRDNGIKFFDRFGFKLPDEKEEEMERLVHSELLEGLSAEAEEIGKATRIDDAKGRYVVFTKSTFPKDLTLEGIRIVVDCANGAAYRVAPIIFEELGADVIGIGVSPNGRNINQDCGSLNPQLLRENVLTSGAHLGIALDGDADRVVFCDEKGEVIDGDKIIAMCANDLLESGKLHKNTVVATEMSNMALENFLKNKGCNLVRTQVGDRYVVEEMRAHGYSFGGEKSGHIIFLEHTTTGDGTLAALQVLAIMRQKDRTLGELARILDLFPQKLVSIRVKEKKPFEEIPGLAELVARSKGALGREGRINLRYSGTEPVARVMVEGEDETLINEIAEEIAEFLSTRIGERV
jgi:phosphoglucosamine mutase